ncbi:MAG: response regulator transcription factor [Actinomycetota bacterium]|nr:response regulator transcription factor [Actinomycetota bacterium]
MATGGHILAVEDERSIRKLLRLYLDEAGYTVTEAADGAEALAKMRTGGIDLVLLDLMIPEIDGLEVCRRIRADHPSIPIIMLTARDDEASRVTGLEMGADDYVTKPFSPRELVARVKAVLRRVQGEQELTGPLRAGRVEMDPVSRTCRLDGDDVELTRLEFDLLAELAAHPNVVFTRERLLERVWGYQSGVGGKTVDVHVANLRRKLGKDLPIVAVRGVGYRLDPSLA